MALVVCPTCNARFDDEFRWTICPHNSLNVGTSTPYCRRHDLYNCHLCAIHTAEPLDLA